MTAIISARSSSNCRPLSNSIVRCWKIFSHFVLLHFVSLSKFATPPGTPTKPKNKPRPTCSPLISPTLACVLKTTPRSNWRHGKRSSMLGSPKASTSTPTANTKTPAKLPLTPINSSEKPSQTPKFPASLLSLASFPSFLLVLDCSHAKRLPPQNRANPILLCRLAERQKDRLGRSPQSSRSQKPRCHEARRPPHHLRNRCSKIRCRRSLGGFGQTRRPQKSPGGNQRRQAPFQTRHPRRNQSQ